MSKEILFINEETDLDSDLMNENHKVLAEDIKLQLALFELYKFYKNKQKYEKDTQFKLKLNRMRFVKNIIMIVYCFMVFFEKPFWCYEKNTFFTNIYKIDNECDGDVNTLNIISFYPYSIFYRIVEIVILITFISLNINLKLHIIHKKNLRQKIIYFLTIFLISICILEVILGLILNFFPMINLVIRAFLIILLNKKLREEWKKIFVIIYKTKSLSFILFFNIFMFSLIGHLVFKKENNEFSTYLVSLHSMFMLMTTCNFPDIMFRVINISKMAVIFFVSYLIINFFIFLSLLKVLIYTNYIEINKLRVLRILKKISHFKIEFKEQDLTYIATFKHKYTLTDSEFEKFKNAINLPPSYKPKIRESLLLTSSAFTKSLDDEENKKRYKLLRLMRMKRTEIIVNIINLIIIGIAIINKKNILEYIIQDLVFLYFILEFAIYTRYYGFNKLLKNKMLRSMFCGINLLGFLVVTYLIFHNLFSNEENLESLINIGKTLIIIRSSRMFILLNLFKEYKIIFTTLTNMKSIFFKLIAIQFSFFFIFSTISMILLGGKIKNDQYFNSKTIPDYYSYINFNNFGSSFLTCFCFLIINNTNIQTEALSLVVGDWFKGYFTIYYFLGIVVLLNIFQTIVLEMYVNIKKSNKI